MKPGDYILIAVLLLSIIVQLFWHQYHQRPAKYAIVSIGDDFVSEISLEPDSLYRFEGFIGVSEIEVAQHEIRMLQSPCPHKTCQKMGSISESGQVIVCVPNRIVIKIEGNAAHDLDGVTQ